MQPKSTRGVQAGNVHQAADQLIADGQRPTIERIRLKLGRGSPNTIAPMLDAWFAQLGTRLGISGGAIGESTQASTNVPAAVWTSVQTLWDQALASARESAQKDLVLQTEALREQRVALEVDRAALDVVVAQVAQRDVQQQRTVEHLQSEVNHWRSSAQSWQDKVSESQRELRAAHEALGAATQERNEERRRHDEQVQTMLDEHRRQAKAAQAEHQRLLAQIDKERQAAKQLAKKLDDTLHTREATQREFQHANSTLGGRLHDAQLEISALQARSQAQDAHVAGLQAQLMTFELKRPPRSRSRTTKKAKGLD